MERRLSLRRPEPVCLLRGGDWDLHSVSTRASYDCNCMLDEIKHWQGVEVPLTKETGCRGLRWDTDTRVSGWKFTYWPRVILLKKRFILAKGDSVSAF
jgi:hypothetical protein